MERLPKALWLGLGLLLLLAPACLSQTASDQALVDRFFPQRVLDDFANSYPGGTPEKQSAFVAADLNGTGTPEFLVAVYATDVRDILAAVRVLRKDGDSAVLVNEPACKLDGHNPKISVIDLDHSGRPQFLVELSVGLHGERAQLILKWNGTALEVFGPYDTDPEDGARQPALFDATFVDLDGDGILEAVNPPGPHDEAEVVPRTWDVYKLAGGAWVKSDVLFDLFAFFIFPENEYEFAVADPAYSHIMTIANGDGRDFGPVASAEIRLNGVLVAGPDRINAQTRILRIPVTVLARNTLSVKVTRSSDTVLEVGIGPEHAPTISIAPAVATLGISATQQFTATFTGTSNTAVRWSLKGPQDSVGPGQIDESGLYTAPDTNDTARTVTVTAWRDADTASIATATINLQPSVRVWMEPPNVSLYQSDIQQFVATVYGTANTAVTWALDPPIGTVSASGLYTAPARVKKSRSVRVTATSRENPTKSAYARVVIIPSDGRE